jgi:hypothetical protein
LFDERNEMTEAVSPTDQLAEILPPASAEPAAPAAAGAELPADDETADGRSYRQRILDAFEDNEGDLTVVQLMQDTGLNRNAVDSTLSVMVKRGLVLRVAQGLYRLAPPALAPELPPAPAEQPRADGVSAEQWLDWLWSWHRSGQWAGPGNPPDRVDGIITANCVVPLDVWMTFLGQRDAIAKQQAEDAALRDQLLPAANGNIIRGSGLNDVRPLRVMLASGVDMATIEQVIRAKHDRRSYPKNLPLQSWGDLLKPVAENYGRFVLGRKMLARWQERLADPDATTAASPVLRKAMAEIALPETAGAPDHGPAVQKPGVSEAARASISGGPAANSSDEGPSATALLLERYGGGVKDAVATVSDDEPSATLPPRPVADGREQVLARFVRSRPGAAPQRALIAARLPSGSAIGGRNREQPPRRKVVARGSPTRPRSRHPRRCWPMMNSRRRSRWATSNGRAHFGVRHRTSPERALSLGTWRRAP